MDTTACILTALVVHYRHSSLNNTQHIERTRGVSLATMRYINHTDIMTLKCNSEIVTVGVRRCSVCVYRSRVGRWRETWPEKGPGTADHWFPAAADFPTAACLRSSTRWPRRSSWHWCHTAGSKYRHTRRENRRHGLQSMSSCPLPFAMSMLSVWPDHNRRR